MNADGSGTPTNLTNNPGDDIHPSWSPDGSKIAFSSDRNGFAEIFLMNADGSFQTPFFPSVFGIDQDWSPDGTKIAYSSGFGSADLEIWTMNVDGTGQVKQTTATGNDTEPHWSPDGSKLVFVSQRDGNREIYVLDLNSGGQSNLTRNAADDDEPDWSPDGTKIVFSSNRENNNKLFTMDPITGGSVTWITNDIIRFDVQPSW